MDGTELGGRPIRVGPSYGPIIQPTAYGSGAKTMRNRPPLYSVSDVGDVMEWIKEQKGFVILDQNAENEIQSRINNSVRMID